MSTWFREYRPTSEATGEPATVVVALPHAGGAASFYRAWADHFPVGWRLLAAKYPGREDRLNDAPTASLNNTVAQISDDLAALTARGDRFLIVGHSLGAIIGWELAHRLEQAGADLALVVISAKTPSIDSTLDPNDSEALARGLTGLDPLFATIEQYPELRDHALAATAADLTHLGAHTMTPQPIASRLLALGGNTDLAVPTTALTGWRERTTGDFWHRILPGGHFYLRGEEGTVVKLIRLFAED
ncbi:MAG: alpha/beta fold hydrolase [Propionibacteriaceae bacterium]|jgi:pyochelin biosynthetic protein PchC|nr:alpha/beta fold hydrolase [Propionibacteriaceae bacterium]